MVDYLDTIILSIILNPDNLEEVYDADVRNTLQVINSDDDDFRYYPLDLKVLKDELHNHRLVKNYKNPLPSDKLALLKTLFPITDYDTTTEEVSYTDISQLFCEDNWKALIKHYMYFRAYNLIDEDNYIKTKVFMTLKLIDYHKRIFPKARTIAINKIRRNSIYNLGLGLKIAKKQYSKDFN
jgi:hypothetical protein